MFINGIKGIAVFLLLGPAIGLLTVVLITTDDWTWSTLAQIIPIAYFIGGIPAAACGLLIGVARPRLQTVSGCLIAGGAGGACSAIFYWLMAGGEVPGRVLTLLIVAGFVAGSVSGAAFLSLGYNRLGRWISGLRRSSAIN